MCVLQHLKLLGMLSITRRKRRRHCFVRVLARLLRRFGERMLTALVQLGKLRCMPLVRVCLDLL